MARAVRKNGWLEIEHILEREAQWRFLVERWLWQAPFAILRQPVDLDGRIRAAPSPEVLQHNAWIMDPESQVSH